MCERETGWLSDWNFKALSLATPDSKFKFLRPVGWNLRQVSLLSLENFFKKPQSLLLRPSVSWLRLTHIVIDNLLYLKSTYSNVNLYLESTDLNINHI